VRIALIGATGDPGSPEGESISAELESTAANGADLIILPQFSFSAYFAARRDRAALELAERLPSGSMGRATASAGDSYLAASVYECVGEGVFYSCGLIARNEEGILLKARQHQVDAAPGRYEQMFISPGFGLRSVANLPWGSTGLLVGADARSVPAWAELAAAGADLVVASVSEGQDLWRQTRSIAPALAAVHGVAVAVVNRASSKAEPDFAGGELVADGSGNELAPGADGIYELTVSPKGEVHD